MTKDGKQNSENFHKYWRAYWNKLQGSKLEKERDLQRRSNIHILDDTLHLSNVNDANSGDYGCTVANAAGSSTSNILTITVSGRLNRCNLTIWFELIPVPFCQ